jgi:8-oxo-dGTP pyrophosphatase MutT (NUDIX family)
LIERKSLYKGRLDFGLEVADLPNGERVALEIVRHPGGSVIVAIDDDGRVCMIRQYRHAVGDWIWELPAGVLDNNEAPLKAAKRELLEETGVKATRWQSLGPIWSTPGFTDEKLHLYSAKELTLGESQPEQGECIEVHWVPLEDLAVQCLNGEVTDGKTIIGLLRAHAAIKS